MKQKNMDVSVSPILFGQSGNIFISLLSSGGNNNDNYIVLLC